MHLIMNIAHAFQCDNSSSFYSKDKLGEMSTDVVYLCVNEQMNDFINICLFYLSHCALPP